MEENWKYHIAKGNLARQMKIKLGLFANIFNTIFFFLRRLAFNTKLRA